MTQTLIEKLEALSRYENFLDNDDTILTQSDDGDLIKYDDLRAIIEEHKLESVDVPTVEELEQEIYAATGVFIQFVVMDWMLKRYYPQPSNKELIRELVEALEKSANCLVDSCMSERNKVYPKPVNRMLIAEKCSRLLTKAREAIK